MIVGMDKLQQGHNALTIPIHRTKCHYRGMPDRSVIVIQDSARDRTHGRHLQPNVLLLFAVCDGKDDAASKRRSLLAVLHWSKTSSDARGNQLVISGCNIAETEFPVGTRCCRIRRVWSGVLRELIRLYRS